MNLFRRRSVADLQDEALHDLRLKRALGPLNLTALGIGAIVGAGIFVLTGQAAARYAGPGIVFSFLLAGVACACAGLCYAELAAMIPISGSAYTYGYATLGELVAWVIGWDLILEYLFAASTVAVGWSGYVTSFLKDFGIILPQAVASAPSAHGAAINIPAMAIIAVLTILLVIGIKESAAFNNVIVAVKLLVVLAFVAVGVGYINHANWHPFVPVSQGPGHFGWGGILRGAGVIFFAYIGFDAVSTTAQEAKNPQRDMPIGILCSLAICTVLYIAVSLVLTGIVSYTRLDVPDPMAVAIDSLGSSVAWLRFFVKIGAIAGLSSVMLVMMMGQPRIFYAMSKDGLLPAAFSAVHPKFRTPWLATTLTGSVAMVTAGLLPIGILGELVSIGTLLAFAIVCAGVFVLRLTHPDLERPFRAPIVWLTAPLGIIFCLWLMYGLPLDTWIRLLVWMAIGFVIYFTYGIRHSKLAEK